MSDDEFDRCMAVLHAWQRPHNLSGYLTRAGVVRSPYAVMVDVRPGHDFATYDGDELTRMVIAAHQHRVRLSLRGHGRGYTRIYLHPRQADGHFFERHPGVDRELREMVEAQG